VSNVNKTKNSADIGIIKVAKRQHIVTKKFLVDIFVKKSGVIQNLCSVTKRLLIVKTASSSISSVLSEAGIMRSTMWLSIRVF
jgi:hypothetical protein